jgi:hypothetical protein
MVAELSRATAAKFRHVEAAGGTAIANIFQESQRIFIRPFPAQGGLRVGGEGSLTVVLLHGKSEGG